MLVNYLKTAIRSLLRHRFFSAINVFGLAVAMSICMVIIMLVADQMSYDRYNSKADRIYQVITLPVNSTGGQPNTASTMKLRPELEEKYTGIEQIVRLKRGFGNSWIQFEGQNVNVPLAGFYADPEVFDLFEYQFEYGDSRTALTEPYSVVLTRKAASKLFKEENPVGQTIQVGELGTYTVTGVLRETANKSHIVFEALASMATVKSVLNDEDYRNDMDSWTNYWAGWTYILPEKGRSAADIQAHLDNIYSEHIGPITNPGIHKMTYSLRPLLSITPGPMWNNSIGPILPWLFVYVLSGLALVILLTSCFNFTNLSIARSLTRAREIGVRKVTGAMRWQIFTQFITESVVVALAALVIALVLVNFLKPLVLQLHFAQIFRWDLQANEAVYVLFLVFAIVVGIIAGLFPAVVLSGFQPVKVLKSLNNLKLFSKMGLRKTLLVSQFTLSLFFILTLLVIYNQLTLFINKDHGFNMRSNIMVRLNNTSHEALKAELSKYNNITSVSAVSHVPAAGTSHGSGAKRQLDDPAWMNMHHFLVDEHYLENMDIKLVAGSFFVKDNLESNKDFIVINQQAARALHFDTDLDAISQEIIMEHDSSRRTIVGVVKDYNHNDLIRAIGPMALIYQPESFSVLQVAYIGSYESAAASIEKAWSTINPDLKVDYKEIESEINQFYEIVFGDMVGVLGVISFLAILISCLGMLGMATYATESRIKEISLRKILGSSDAALVMLLSRGFLTMLGLAIAIGVPAAYFINGLWLNLIAYHTSLDLLSISIGVVILTLFGVITVGSQTLRATMVKPVDNLKSE